jgi:hypothetical protein
MALSKNPFTEAFGQADTTAEPLQFTEQFLQEDWLWRQQTMTAGWFLGHYFYLFGQGLERMNPCLEAWSFILPPAKERRIIGYNAYGALLVLENETDEGLVAPVCLLDPTRVIYWKNEECVYGTLLTRWLPKKLIPHFFDTIVYKQWLESANRFLDTDEILGIRAAVSLGGEMNSDNFTAMNIIEYYRITGPVYAKVYDQSGKPE